ncbi:unnamed protein product [Caenorhabditis angaria]|uniref:Uncharacterized protein n=1 Tax=Caenorhabditis angaria TaxID=860376 RepID=A0A9P1ISJ9_9PELO|nr:unnamed protein product [Caenorhabditis angaria]
MSRIWGILVIFCFIGVNFVKAVSFDIGQSSHHLPNFFRNIMNSTLSDIARIVEHEDGTIYADELCRRIQLEFAEKYEKN